MCIKFGIVGNRIGWDKDFVLRKISDILMDKKANATTTTIVSGGAKGIDEYAKLFADLTFIKYVEFKPNAREPIPERYFNRNKKIAETCDVLIAFDKADGRSGTKNTIRYAKELNKEVILIDSYKA